MTDRAEHEGIPASLLWLSDAPMFIDDKQIGRFYDAVVRPANTEGAATYQVTSQQVNKLANRIGAKGGFVLGGLASFLGIGKAVLEANLEQAKESGGTDGTTRTLTLEAIHTPQRQLVQLTAHYLLTYPDRFFYIEDVSGRYQPAWWDGGTTGQQPRSLAFLNLPSMTEAREQRRPHTTLIPVAAEFTNGAVVTYFDQIEGVEGGPPPPVHPDVGDAVDYAEKKREHWRWFSRNVRLETSMELIERSVRDQQCRIQSIDFRVPISAAGDTLQLHIAGQGEYDTTTFAYKLIRRGYEFGIRLVGTLKAGPDMNVLAIYER